MNITLRPAVAEDRSFVFATYFQSERPVLEQLFGWSGDEFEADHFDNFYSQKATQIILVDDQDAGFLSLIQRRTYTEIECLFLLPQFQNRGIGTHLLRRIMAQAATDGTRLAIGTHHINPAKRLYKRLGFVVVREFGSRIEFAYPDPYKGPLG